VKRIKPVIFAGDWCVMPDAEIKYYSMEKGIQKKKKIPWNEY
jgi:hypothetical protein